MIYHIVLTLHTMNLPVVIVGAGVAGLSLSINLALKGVKSIILESRDSFNEKWTSGVRISATGVKILEI